MSSHPPGEEPVPQPTPEVTLDELGEVEGRTGRGRRTWFQRLILSLNVLVVFACLTAALALSNFREDVAQINRIEAQGTLTTVEQPLAPVNFLVVGVDNAEGLDPDDPVLRGRNQASLLSDTIMVVRVDPASNKAWLLSIPRDLYVPIAGTGTRNKINSALALGDPARLIETVQESLEIPIHHYVQVNFFGFTRLVEQIGGVPVWFEYPARDQNSGLHVESAGCVNLEGDQALAFVRSRMRYEVLVDGRWVRDPTSDLGRISRQQVFVRAALNRAIAQGARNPFEMRKMIEATQGEVVLDDELSINALVDLGTRFREFDPEQLETFTLPVVEDNVGGMSVVRLQEAEAQPILEIFRGGNVFGGLNALVRVEVRNGSGVAGQAGEVAAALRDHGFTVTGTGDASERLDRTVIRFRPDQGVAAVVLSQHLPGTIELEEDPSMVDGSVGLVLVSGDDWQAVLAEPRPIEEFEDLLEQFAPEADTATEPISPADVALPTTTTTRPVWLSEPPDGVVCG